MKVKKVFTSKETATKIIDIILDSKQTFTMHTRYAKLLLLDYYNDMLIKYCTKLIKDYNNTKDKNVIRFVNTIQYFYTLKDKNPDKLFYILDNY